VSPQELPDLTEYGHLQFIYSAPNLYIEVPPMAHSKEENTTKQIRSLALSLDRQQIFSAI